MVLKLSPPTKKLCPEFESSVNSDGTQTDSRRGTGQHRFESSVNSDGTQTRYSLEHVSHLFESSVNSDGTQTNC